MALGGLSEMLGMGIMVQLRDMFSAPARAITSSSRQMTDSIVADTKRSTDGWRLLGAGTSLMFAGTSIIGLIGGIGKVSLKSSNDLEILRNQIRLLARDTTVGDNLFTQLTQFSTTTPFTLPQVMAGAKNLLSFGMRANKVMQELKLAGEWAAMMDMPVDYAAMILGKINSGGMSQAMRFAQVRGISYKDIAEAGGPIDIKNMRTIKGADPQQFLRAMNKVIQDKFGGGMKLYMSTLPGMMTNLQDQMILLGARIGDRIKPEIKNLMMAVLSTFNPDLIVPFAKSVGEALAFVLKVAEVVLVPLGKLTVFLMQIGGQYPILVKLGVAAAFLTGALLSVAGASLIIMGIWRLLNFFLGEEAIVGIASRFLGMLGPIGVVIGALGLLYYAYRNNFLGMHDIVGTFFADLSVVASGLGQLFTSMTSGVGQISQTTYDALQNAGLLNFTILLFELGYRAMKFLEGVWLGIVAFGKTLAFIGSVAKWATYPLLIITGFAMRLIDVFGSWNLVGHISVNLFRNLGAVVGYATGIIAVYWGWLTVVRTATILWTLATLAWTAVTNAARFAMVAFNIALVVFREAAMIAQIAMWSLNAAMDANPVALIIIGVTALIAILGLATYEIYKHRTAIGQWFSHLWLIRSFMPILAAGISSVWHGIGQVIEGIGGVIERVATRIKNGITGIIDTALSTINRLPPWIRAGLIGSALTLGGPVAHTAAASTLNTHQASQLSNQNTHGVTHQTGTLMSMDDKLGRMEQFSRIQAQQGQRPIQVVVALDGKVVGKAVTKNQEQERDSGR